MNVPAIALHDGNTIPQIGLGTWELNDDVCVDAIVWAAEAGYRHFDTATLYKNEKSVGRGLAATGLARDEFFVTSKVWNDAHAPADARKAIETTLTDLGLDHLDLYLIHWPATVRYGESFVETWNALQDFKAEGLTRSIGVANMHAHHLDALEGAKPVIDQIELHPHFNQADVRADLKQRGIAVQAWSPLGAASVLTDEAINDIAESIGRSAAQVILRWHIQHGIIAIPRSSNRERIADNIKVFDFELTDEQMSLMDSLSSPDGRTGADPETARF